MISFFSFSQISFLKNSFCVAYNFLHDQCLNDDDGHGDDFLVAIL